MERFVIVLITVAFIVGMAVFGGSDGRGIAVDDDGGNDVQSCTLAIDSTAGGAVALNNSTISGKATFIFGAGTVVRLKAVPDSGYQFIKWIGDVGTVGDVHASEIIVTVDGNYSIMAKFEVPPPVRYTLSILSTPGGSVTAPGRGTYVYDAGTVVNLAAAPASGYKFARWSGSVGIVADVNATSTSITMNGDYYICANFREDRHCG